MIICEYLNYEAELLNRKPETVEKKKFLHACWKKFHAAREERIVHQLTRVGLSGVRQHLTGNKPNALAEIA
jgi:hypothetical protein